MDARIYCIVSAINFNEGIFYKISDGNSSLDILTLCIFPAVNHQIGVIVAAGHIETVFVPCGWIWYDDFPCKLS
jgi:hypothetical protein